MNRRYLFFLFLLLPNYLLAQVSENLSMVISFVVIILLVISLGNIPILIFYIIKKKKKTAYWLIFAAISNSILGCILLNINNSDTKTFGPLLLGLGLYSIAYATYHLVSRTADKYD